MTKHHAREERLDAMLEVIACDVDETLTCRGLIQSFAPKWRISVPGMRTYITDLEARRFITIVGTGKFEARGVKITKEGLSYLTDGKALADDGEE